MYGRYGADNLGIALFVMAMAVSMTARLTKILYLFVGVWLLLGWEIYRFLSKKTDARRCENAVFLRFWNPTKKWFKLQYSKIRDIRTHRYFTCPNCKNALRVPKGKGEITITCPVCKTRFDKKT